MSPDSSQHVCISSRQTVEENTQAQDLLSFLDTDLKISRFSEP